MRGHERNSVKLKQMRRKMWRLSQYRVHDNERSVLAELRTGPFTAVEGVPGLTGRIVPAPAAWGEHVTLALFQWKKAAGKFHTFNFHYHQEEEMLVPIIGHIEMVVEGKTEVIGPGDSLIIAPTALHLAKPLNDCLFFAAFQPPLEAVDLSPEDL